VLKMTSALLEKLPIDNVPVLHLQIFCRSFILLNVDSIIVKSYNLSIDVGFLAIHDQKLRQRFVFLVQKCKLFSVEQDTDVDFRRVGLYILARWS